MTRRGRRISVESAYCCIAHGHICNGYGGIERDAQHRAKRNRVVSRRFTAVTGQANPVSLRRRSGAEVEANPDVGIVRANHCDGLIFRRILHLIDERTVAQAYRRAKPGHVLASWIVRYDPVSGTHGSVATVDRLVYPICTGNQMTATTWDAGRRTVIATRNPAVEEIVRQDERLPVPRPVSSHTTPSRASYSAVAHATAHSTAVVTLEKAEIGSGANGINA